MTVHTGVWSRMSQSVQVTTCGFLEVSDLGRLARVDLATRALMQQEIVWRGVVALRGVTIDRNARIWVQLYVEMRCRLRFSIPDTTWKQAAAELVTLGKACAPFRKHTWGLLPESDRHQMQAIWSRTLQQLLLTRDWARALQLLQRYPSGWARPARNGWIGGIARELNRSMEQHEPMGEKVAAGQRCLQLLVQECAADTQPIPPDSIGPEQLPTYEQACWRSLEACAQTWMQYGYSPAFEILLTHRDLRRADVDHVVTTATHAQSGAYAESLRQAAQKFKAL
jgi:hypothetical protein